MQLLRKRAVNVERWIGPAPARRRELRTQVMVDLVRDDGTKVHLVREFPRGTCVSAAAQQMLNEWGTA